MILPRKYCRRTLLRGLGLGGALLPLLDLELEARAAVVPKRLVSMVWPNGVTRAWWPSGGETDFTLGAAMKSLEPIKDDIVIVDDMQLKAFQDEHPGEGGHTSFRQLLAGGGGSKSIDQHVASVHGKKYGTQFPSLVIGVDNKEETKPRLKWVSFDPNPVPYQDDPYKLYAKLFAGAAPSTGGADALARLRAERKSILDWVGRDLERFGRDLGTDDRRKTEAHLASVRQIERQLDGIQAAGPTSAPRIEQGLNPYDKKVYDKLVKIQLDTTVAALAANVTSVVTMCWNSSHNNVWVFYWLGAEFSQPGRGEFNKLRNHHEIAHHGSSGDDHRRKNLIDDWFMSQLTYLALELKKRPDAGGGNLLDNSLLFWANCMEDGGAHSTNRMPFVLAGRAGGALKTGRWVRQGKRVPHNGLLVSIAKMMDAPTEFLGPAKYGSALANL